jgi:hypothetical protein
LYGNRGRNNILGNIKIQVKNQAKDAARNRRKIIKGASSNEQ